MKSEKRDKETGKTLAAAGVIISMMIGAGFASGRELMTFFARFGERGYLGLVLAIVLLALCSWAVMDISVRMGIKGYTAFMSVVLGRRLGQIMAVVVNIFIFVIMATMFSGFGAAYRETVGRSFTEGVAVIAVLCFVTLLFNLQGIVRVSAVLAPVLVAGGLVFGLYSAMTGAAPAFAPSAQESIINQAFIYASYNLITAVPVMVALSSTLGKRRQAMKASAISGGIIAALGLAFMLPMIMNLPVLSGLELPLLSVARANGGFVQLAYIAVLFAAIFTTAISDGFAVTEWLGASPALKRLRVPSLAVKLAVPLGAALLAHIGFSAFVDMVYPFFGYAGLFEIAAVLIYALFAKARGSVV